MTTVFTCARAALVCCFLAISVASAQEATKDEPTAIEERIVALYGAVSSKNADTLHACFLKDAVVLLPMGILLPSDTVIETIVSGKFPFAETKVTGKNVTVCGDVASAWVSVSASAKVGAPAETMVDLLQLVKRDGAWKVTALVSTQQKDGVTIPLMTPVTVEKTEIGDAPKLDSEPAKEAAAAGEVITSLTMDDSAPESSGGATEAPAPKTETEAAKTEAESATPATPVEGQAPAEATEPVVILATTAGEITIRLFEKDAPETVKNFLEHTKEKRYDNTYFHRVFAGKMIQGGDFNTKNDNREDDGKGGYSYKGVGTRLKFEKNTRTHQRGSVSMAHGKELDSAGSQFFILLAPAKSYDGQYCVFGEVISGIEAVEAISKMPGKELKNGGVNPDVAQRITAGRVDNWPVSKIESTRAEKNM